MDKDGDMEDNFGLMDQYMKENGNKMQLLEKVNLYMAMVINMKVNGKMIKLMGLEFIHI